jgi:hypothetical protein
MEHAVVQLSDMKGLIASHQPDCSTTGSCCSG